MELARTSAFTDCNALENTARKWRTTDKKMCSIRREESREYRTDVDIFHIVREAVKGITSKRSSGNEFTILDIFKFLLRKNRMYGFLFESKKELLPETKYGSFSFRDILWMIFEFRCEYSLHLFRTWNKIVSGEFFLVWCIRAFATYYVPKWTRIDRRWKLVPCSVLIRVPGIERSSWAVLLAR